MTHLALQPPFDAHVKVQLVTDLSLLVSFLGSVQLGSNCIAVDTHGVSIGLASLTLFGNT